jgi:hypothetical protein
MTALVAGVREVLVVMGVPLPVKQIAAGAPAASK